jgi:hypothetical protein
MPVEPISRAGPDESRVSRPRVLWLLLSAIASLAAGFVLVSPGTAEKAIVAGGYFYILAVVLLWVVLASRVFGKGLAHWKERRFRPGYVAFAWLACAIFSATSDDLAPKVLFDEHVVQGTAWHLHANKEVGTPVRAYEVAGSWTAIDVYLDKRPYLLPFLISIAHDLTGYRPLNAFALNVLLAAVCLGLAGWIARHLSGSRGAAVLVMVLLATTPLFGQNATGSGLEMLNLTLIAALAVATILYLELPDDSDRLSLLAVTTVLLAQSRYESVLFSVAAAGVIATGWWRARRMVLPWALLATPLLLIPWAWHSRIVDSRPQLWELREGESARFSWRYVSGNLEGAWEFFRSVSPGQPGSLALVLLGMAGAFALVARILRRSPAPLPARAVAVAWVGLGVAAHFVVVQFYYWARFDEPVTARFALPSLLILALLSGVLVRLAPFPRPVVLRAAFAGWMIWLVASGGPAFAQRLYTERNLVRHEVEWEVAQARARRGPVLVITSKATLPFILERIPAVNLSVARLRGPELAWHLERGTFREVLVTQVIRPTSAEGFAAVDPADALPEGFRLETIDRKRFGARWVRLSRLVAVEPAAPEPRPAD